MPLAAKHLSSELRQDFFFSLFVAGCLAYLATKVGGGLPLATTIASAACMLGASVGIYRVWLRAHWLFAAGILCFCIFGVHHLFLFGYSHLRLLGILATAYVAYDARDLGRELLRHAVMKEVDESELFELPAEKEPYVEALNKAYARAFGPPRWVHHIVPKSIFLHPLADYVITIPPTDTRKTWLYGTLLISTQSDHTFELILERPEVDTLGAIGTLARLTDYVLELEPVEEWHTMGPAPFYGEDSDVRGLLFSKPPDELPQHLLLSSGAVDLLYVSGITKQQLETAQAADNEYGDFRGARSLHASLNIAQSGIANVPQ